jgi:chitodextrinase
MIQKHRILKIAIMTLMVLSTSLVTSDTLAYWSNGLQTSSNNAIASIAVGDWNQVLQWDSNATYNEGDQVINDGVIYTAKRNNPSREPGVDKGWQRDWQD